MLDPFYPSYHMVFGTHLPTLSRERTPEKVNTCTLNFDTLLLHFLLNHGFSSGANADPLYGYLEVLLDELDILLAVFGEVVIDTDLLDGRLPSGEGNILDVNLCQGLEVSYRRKMSAND